MRNALSRSALDSRFIAYHCRRIVFFNPSEAGFKWVRRLLFLIVPAFTSFHNTIMKNTNTTAAELAANFQVAELEPRLENSWSNMSGDTSGLGVPSCPDGQAPDSNGQC